MIGQAHYRRNLLVDGSRDQGPSTFLTDRLARDAVSPRPQAVNARAVVRGKFLCAAGEKLWVRGVTYGTFRPDPQGDEYPDPSMVDTDFRLMAANGINTVRVYTMPPRWLLDAAQQNGLRVMVSLAVERNVGYLADGRKWPAVVDRKLRDAVMRVAGHPALLCYAIGNEIPAAMVRWLGRRRVERRLKRVYAMIKACDPHGLVTYVNYPTAEYLQLSFLDFVCFNVYLERAEDLNAYLARLHNIARDRPLVMGEIGLDSLRHTEERQAHTLDWQLRAAFDGGCAGAFVYSWTDEWHRGGEDVHDWAFGLVRRDRSVKPALASVRTAFADLPFVTGVDARVEGARSLSVRSIERWPSVSVVVCSYNGEARIRECCEALCRVEYPNFEVIVVDDGSTDATGDTAAAYGFQVIRTPNLGLSNARNVGLRAAKGEIVAYLDDDAYPDLHWLHYLTKMFRESDHVGVGGPNVVPTDDGLIAQCVAHAPGGPMHVLLTDRVAEHIPGCNMAFRREALEAIGGFDSQFRVAGDDVDICWRLQERGWTLGFSPSAMVWHRRRSSIRQYWKQQHGYGRAETMLEAKWPSKYNLAGHVTWAGRIYDTTPPPILGGRSRIYQGIWGTAPFQTVHPRALGALPYLPHMPEWHLVNAALLLIALTGVFWPPLLWTLPLLMASLLIPIIQGARAARSADYKGAVRSKSKRVRLRAITAFLHVTQPLARLHGRLRHGMTPWRNRSTLGLSVPRPWTIKRWTDRWQSPEDRLKTVEKSLRAARCFVVIGGEYDRWDLEVRSGLLGAARMLSAVEEQGGGCQTVRFRLWPTCSWPGLAVVVALWMLAWGAGTDRAWIALGILSVAAGALSWRILVEAAIATAALLESIEQQ